MPRKDLHKIVLFTAIILLFPIMARAEPSIAYIDVQRLMTESDAAKSIQSQVQKQRAKFLDELAVQEQKLNAERKQLEESAGASKGDLAAKRKAFEEHFQEARKSAQKRKKDLEESLAKAMLDLKNEISKVVKSIAAEKGYDLVLSKQAVLVGDESADISKEAMTRLNKAISQITLNTGAK